MLQFTASQHSPPWPRKHTKSFLHSRQGRVEVASLVRFFSLKEWTSAHRPVPPLSLCKQSHAVLSSFAPPTEAPKAPRQLATANWKSQKTACQPGAKLHPSCIQAAPSKLVVTGLYYNFHHVLPAVFNSFHILDIFVNLLVYFEGDLFQACFRPWGCLAQAKS